jgi:tetratricopeptide (TPR) repeat protein
LRRCVLELHAIAVKKAESGSEFAVAMTALEKRRFLDGIHDVGAYYNMLGRVDVARSDCSRAADRESIHAGIRDSVGFGQLGRMVLGVMEEWMVGELQAQAAAKREEGDERGEMRWCLVLGTVLGEQGRSDKAVGFQETALAIGRRVLDEDDADLGVYMNNLAATYSALGRDKDALAMEESVLEFRRRVLPPNHPLIGDSMGNLAVTFGALGRDEEALAMKVSVLEFRRRVLPPNHPRIGLSMISLAVTYSALGRDKDALAMEESALEFRRRVLPPNHPDIATTLYNISLSHERAGDMRRAVECAREALDIWRAALPPSHPHVRLAEDKVRQLERKVQQQSSR